MEPGMGIDPKVLLKQLKDSGADTAAAKDWFKRLDKIKKYLPSVSGKYNSALASLHECERICMRMEELLMEDSFDIEQQMANSSTLSARALGNYKTVVSLSKELKKQRNRFDHIFVISGMDEQFHLIYETVVRMGSTYTGAEGEQLIFQSEVENLLDLMRDCFDRREPDMFAYSYYCIEHGEKLLYNLPAEECLGKIERVCRREFTDVMERMLCEGPVPDEQKAKEIVEWLCRRA